MNQCISNVRKCVCNDISHVLMRKRDKNSPRTSTCDDFLASTIAISGVRCYTVMKDHVQSTHMPSLFVQLEPEDRALGNTHRQRLNGLTQLARSLLGPNATPHTLMNHVNSRLQDIIHAWANIWVPLQLDLKALCKFAR